MNSRHLSANLSKESDLELGANAVTVVVFGQNGGMAHYAEMLVEPLRARLGANLYFGLDPSPTAAQPISEVSVWRWIRYALARAASRAGKYSAARYRLMAKDVVRRFSPRIVHITSPSVGLWPFVKELVSSGVEVIYTVHDPLPHEESQTLWGRLFSWGQRKFTSPKVFSHCAAIHIHSKIHADQLAELYGADLKNKMYVAQHGAGLPNNIMLGTEVPAEMGLLARDYPTMLFFGRIEVYKGLGVLFDAIKIIESKRVGFNLIIAGSGILPSTLGDLMFVNLVIANRYIKDEEVRALFECSDVVVLPYTSATQSGVIPIACAFGKPVIASRVGACHELVIDRITGLLVSPGDPSELAGAIVEMLAGELNVKEMGAAARELSHGLLAWSAVADVHIEQYRGVLAKKKLPAQRSS